MTNLTTSQSLEIWGSLVRDSLDILDLGEEVLHESLVSLTRAVQSRGLSVLFLDLPDICSDFEYSLEIGWYKRRFKGTLSSLDDLLPKFLGPLYQRVFSLGGVLLEEPCVESIRILRQLLRCFKKYEVECPLVAKEKAIGLFQSIEGELPAPLLNWGDRDLRCIRGWPSLTDLVQRNLRRPEIRQRLSEIDPSWDDESLLRLSTSGQSVADSILGKFLFDESSSRPKHGPGAVSEGYRTTKFEFPTWNYRLEKFFPFDIYGLVNHTYLGEENETSNFRDDIPSKLIAVFKDYKGPRLIASEPIAAQYIQQLILGDLRKNVKRSAMRHSIDFRSQVPSRELAMEASRKPEKWSTMDLSSASDRLSCAVVECMFRTKFSYLEILNAARTPTVLMPDGTILDNKKFAAQGAAFMFPVQTIVYAILCAGVIRHHRTTDRLTNLFRSLRVYGDDLIVPRSYSTEIALLLTSLDMVVNQSKSFSQGSFRESCGMDAYAGYDVTPAYVRTVCTRRSPTETRSAVDCSNNLYLRGFIRTSTTLLDLIPKEIRQDIPYVKVGSNLWGIVGPNTWARKQRYNRHWQRHEVRVLSLKDASRKLRPEGAHRLHQWFVEEPMQDRVYDPYRIMRSRVRFSVSWVPADMLQRSPITDPKRGPLPA